MEEHQRIFLLLQNEEQSKEALHILHSLVGLAKEIIEFMHEKNKYGKLIKKLDNIKKFAAGIERAKHFEKDYKLARLYPKMFSFHQFFNSSFRARQGKALEAITQYIIKEHTSCDQVPQKVSDMQSIIKETLALEKEMKLDVDVFAQDSSRKRAIIIQLRSRDDTGGTTAKGSLVDSLKHLIKNSQNSEYHLTYLVGVWDKRESMQKKSTVSKMYSSLAEVINVDEGAFAENIEKGIDISRSVVLKLAYGRDEIEKSLFVWDDKKNKELLGKFERVEQSVMNWDDLWVSYAVASLEMDNYYVTGKSNVEILEKYLQELEIIFTPDYNPSDIDALASKVADMWKENTIPLSSPAEQRLYVRDLLYLNLIYKTRIRS